MAAELDAAGGPARSVWTTGSWILQHALSTGSAAQRAAMDEAVRRGALAWHALPVTTHTELMDATLVRSGLGISAELDALNDPAAGVPQLDRTIQGLYAPGSTCVIIQVTKQSNSWPYGSSTGSWRIC